MAGDGVAANRGDRRGHLESVGATLVGFGGTMAGFVA